MWKRRVATLAAQKFGMLSRSLRLDKVAAENIRKVKYRLRACRWRRREPFYLEVSAPEGIRTPNLLIRSQMLYPLSYGRMCSVFNCPADAVSRGGGERI